MHAGDLRQRNLCLIGRWRGRGLRKDTCRRGQNEDNPKNRIPDYRPHLGYLYIVCPLTPRKYKVVSVLSRLVRQQRMPPDLRFAPYPVAGTLSHPPATTPVLLRLPP